MLLFKDKKRVESQNLIKAQEEILSFSEAMTILVNALKKSPALHSLSLEEFSIILFLVQPPLNKYGLLRKEVLIEVSSLKYLELSLSLPDWREFCLVG